MLDPEKEGSAVKLPPPKERGEMSLEKPIPKRRSVREYKGEPLSLSHPSQVLWDKVMACPPKWCHLQS